MGYYAESRECDIRIPLEHVPSAEAAAGAALGYVKGRALKEVFEYVGFDSTWASPTELRVDGFAMNYPQKWTRDVDALLKAVARWAVPGSYVIFEGEDKELWMDYLDGEGLHELAPKVSLIECFDVSALESFSSIEGGEAA